MDNKLPVTIVVKATEIYQEMMSRDQKCVHNDAINVITRTIRNNADLSAKSKIDVIDRLLETATSTSINGKFGEYFIIYAYTEDLEQALTLSSCSMYQGGQVPVYIFVGSTDHALRMRGAQCTDAIAKDIEGLVISASQASRTYRRTWVDAHAALHMHYGSVQVKIPNVNSAAREKHQVLKHLFDQIRKRDVVIPHGEWIGRLMVKIGLILDSVQIVNNENDPIANCRWLDDAETYAEVAGYILQVPDFWEKPNASI